MTERSNPNEDKEMAEEELDILRDYESKPIDSDLPGCGLRRIMLEYRSSPV